MEYRRTEWRMENKEYETQSYMKAVEVDLFYLEILADYKGYNSRYARKLYETCWIIFSKM